MQPGIYDDIPNEIYQSSEGVSVSKLKRFAKAPAKALIRQDETPALALGSLIHTAVLEPEQLEARYCVTQLDRRGTKAWEAAELAAEGRVLVKQPDWDEACAIRDAVMVHSVARELLAPGLLVEQSFYWRDEATGLLRRGRADGVRPEMRVLVDVKSTVDASREEFRTTVARYKYHWQQASYATGYQAAGGFEPQAFIFLAIEKEPPYLVGAYEIDPWDIEEANADLPRLMERFAECVRTGVWPGYSDTLETLDRLPPWAHAA